MILNNFWYLKRAVERLEDDVSICFVKEDNNAYDEDVPVSGNMGGVWCKADKGQPRSFSPKVPFNSTLSRWTENVRSGFSFSLMITPDTVLFTTDNSPR